jgi:hypothetical protein
MKHKYPSQDSRMSISDQVILRCGALIVRLCRKLLERGCVISCILEAIVTVGRSNPTSRGVRGGVSGKAD